MPNPIVAAGFVGLRDEHREHIPETLRCCEKYLGRPYDYRYQLDDESIYCSELIYKSFRDATNGQQLCSNCGGDIRLIVMRPQLCRLPAGAVSLRT